MSGIVCQTLPLVTEFDGTLGKGLFSFKELQHIARTTRVVLTSLSYSEDSSGPPLTTDVTFEAVKPGGLPTERMLIGEGSSAVALLNLAGNARLRLCGIVLPREPGDNGIHWDIIGFTKNKTENASMCVDFVLCPYPESHERGSPDK